MSSLPYLVALQSRLHWRSLFALAVITGVLGSAVIAVSLGAARTTTSFDRLKAGSNSPAAFVADFFQPIDVARLGKQPGIAATALLPVSNFTFEGAAPGYQVDVVDNLEFGRTLEKGAIVRGRAYNPAATNEAVVDERFVELTGIDVGDTRTIRLPKGDDEALGESGSYSGQPISVTIVGVQRAPLMLWDDDGRDGSVFLSPGFFRAHRDAITAGGQVPPFALVWLEPGRGLEAITNGLTEQGITQGQTILPIAEQVRVIADSLRLQGNTLAAVALVLALAGIALIGLVIGRVVRVLLDQSERLSAVGLTQYERGVTAVVQVGVAAAVGSCMAIGVAWLASNYFPAGLARTIEPRPGRAFSGWILVGALVSFGLTVGLSTFSAWRALRAEQREVPQERSASLWLPGLSVPSLLAVRNAVSPRGRTRNGAALLWAACLIAVLGISTSVTLAGGLSMVATTPSIYGGTADARFDFDVESDSAADRTRAVSALRSDPRVSQVWESRTTTSNVNDAQIIITAPERPGGLVPAVVVRGRLPEAADEIALGPKDLRDARAQIGDEIDLTPVTNGPVVAMRVVGEVLINSGDQPTFDTGSVIAAEGYEPLKPAFQDERPWVAVDLKPGESVEAWITDLQRTSQRTAVAYRPAAPAISLLKIRSTPVLLAVLLGLVAAAAAALALMLQAGAVRRDHAVLRCLGLSRRESFGVLPRQAAVVALLACAVMVPLGVILGLRLWRLISDGRNFAYVAPSVGLPGVLVMIGTLVVMVLLALGPAAALARTSPAAMLRRE